MNEKRVIVYGAGKNTENLIPLIHKLKYTIVGICDSDHSKIGCSLKGYKIFSKEEALKICRHDHDVIIVNGARKSSAKDEINHIIKEEFPKETEVIPEYEFRRYIYKQELNAFHNNMRYGWEVDLVGQFSKWINSYNDEIDYWLSCVSSDNSIEARKYKNLICTGKRGILFNEPNLKECVKDGSIVMATGCSLISSFGEELSNGGTIRLIPVDALAHHYNIINTRAFDTGEKESMCN